MPLKTNTKFDAANIASKLPEPLRKPAGMTIQALMDLMGADDPMGGAYPTPLAAPAITLLSKGQMLNNLLNHVEDLKGTPYEKAAEALAEKSPHVFGSIEKIRQGDVPKFASVKKMPLWATGAFWTNPIHELSGMVRRGFGVGDVSMQPNALKRVFANPNKSLGHEVTHAAQALMKGPHKFDQLYQEELMRVGYPRSEYELGAQLGGINLDQAMKGKRHLPSATESQLVKTLLERLDLK